MEKWNFGSRFLRFIYQQIFLRFSSQIREPYLVRVDEIFTDVETNELSVSFHIAHKRVNEDMTVSDFVKSDMIYLIEPHIVFSMGQQFGVHSERLFIQEKRTPNSKSKCAATLKRIFVDE